METERTDRIRRGATHRTRREKDNTPRMLRSSSASSSRESSVERRNQIAATEAAAAAVLAISPYSSKKSHRLGILSPNTVSNGYLPTSASKTRLGPSWLRKRRFQQGYGSSSSAADRGKRIRNIGRLMSILAIMWIVMIFFQSLFGSRIERVPPVQSVPHPPSNVRKDKVEQETMTTNHQGISLPVDVPGRGNPSGSIGVDARKRQDKIPNVLIFTHHINLLTTPKEELTDPEDVVLQENVLHTIKMHKQADDAQDPTIVRFLTDEDCVVSITNALGADTPLLEYFQKETKGMYKADICRGAALYETGGLYFDVDLEARMNVFEAMQHENADFVVPMVHVDSNHRGMFFQAFIGASPRHEIIRKYLDFFIDYYEHRHKVDGPLGVILLRHAHDAIAKEQRGVVELWQEVLWNKKVFPNVETPLGKRRACHFVVAAFGTKENKKKHVSIAAVPFYSRVRGSRMCGGKDSKK
mmetsp:Transcript_23182/g.41876  ORF Transcript_23182/g.41876 Transcript_23182/m.41876 type:complete len:470 (-) Transcript_23182:35-1444(-)